MGKPNCLTVVKTSIAKHTDSEGPTELTHELTTRQSPQFPKKILSGVTFLLYQKQKKHHNYAASRLKI
jgi:hypothetical protein